MSALSPVKLKVILVGSSGSGKTSLHSVYKQGQFPTSRVSHVWEHPPHLQETEEGQVEAAVWDTRDYEEQLRTILYAHPPTQVVLICFSVVEEDTMMAVETKWLPEIVEHCKCEIVLVGCKTDLRREREEDKVVTEEEGRNLAKKIGAFGYVECSAKDNKGVAEVFKLALKAALKTLEDENKEKVHSKGCLCQ
eukprot:GFUD01020138.1.p1 GENE.GFUD01020138.1~~GFUD01020138.1.p1  ORF type:complete len:193 (+),score=69.57 GFUD01020138.1:37-615(+)